MEEADEAEAAVVTVEGRCGGVERSAKWTRRGARVREMFSSGRVAVWDLLTCASLLFALLAVVAANTEKLIFTAPPAITRTGSDPGVHSLGLHNLTPAAPSLRTTLPVRFLGEETLHGAESWYLLDNLVEGQRYEIRICWAAIPTSFELDIYNLTHVFDSPELVQSLAGFSQNRIEGLSKSAQSVFRSGDNKQQTVLFLRIRSSADFFTSNTNLMLNPPPVHADLILDPYLGSILPRSLIATLSYIIFLIFASIVVSKSVWGRLQASIKQHSD
nr:hypothetical protein CFP56_44262 [Quercus suber]